MHQVLSDRSAIIRRKSRSKVIKKSLSSFVFEVTNVLMYVGDQNICFSNVVGAKKNRDSMFFACVCCNYR